MTNANHASEGHTARGFAVPRQCATTAGNAMNEMPSRPEVFHSGSSKVYDEVLQGSMGRTVRARKREHAVLVRFADQAAAVETLEGVVHAKLGDAIVTGLFGENWPVARDTFAGKYDAVPPLEMGAPGRYLTLPVEVLAVEMNAPFDVVLADGHSRLKGEAGDWLVDYGDGNLGIVNAAIFDATYEILGAA